MTYSQRRDVGEIPSHCEEVSFGSTTDFSLPLLASPLGASLFTPRVPARFSHSGEKLECFDSGIAVSYDDLEADRRYNNDAYEIELGGQNSNFLSFGYTTGAPPSSYGGRPLPYSVSPFSPLSLLPEVSAPILTDWDGDGRKELSARNVYNVGEGLTDASSYLTYASGALATATALSAAGVISSPAALPLGVAAGITGSLAGLLSYAGNKLEGHYISFEYNFEPGSITENVEVHIENVYEAAQDSYEEIREFSEDIMELHENFQDFIELDITPTVKSSHSRLQALMD